MAPKVFISYSWNSPTHQLSIKELADRLLSDGIDVEFDIYNLGPGADKYAFMEKMVTDESITHVLIICDKEYSEKANSRIKGAGEETQIISPEVYKKVEQNKFIPIVTEFDDNGNPYMPEYLKSRIYINFSNLEAINSNWEQLVREIYNKPQYIKPKLGETPLYISSDVELPTSQIQGKFNSLREAVFQQKRTIPLYRRDFLATVIEYAENLRMQEKSETIDIAKRVLDDARKLVAVRNLIVDWVLLESEVTPSEEMADSIVSFLEKLLALKSRPPGISAWNNDWLESDAIFIYDTFLYIVASLIKTKAFEVLHIILTSYYLLPDGERPGNSTHEKLDVFYSSSNTLSSELSKDGRRPLFPTAAFIKLSADRSDLPFINIMEADLLLLLMSAMDDNLYWFPQTLVYAQPRMSFPLFLRASQHNDFLKLAKITGIDDADVLREKVNNSVNFKHSRLNVFITPDTMWNFMNLDNLNKLV